MTLVSRYSIADSGVWPRFRAEGVTLLSPEHRAAEPGDAMDSRRTRG